MALGLKELTRKARWLLLKRKFEAIFAFVIVNETLIQELPIFDDFPHIRDTLSKLLGKAIKEELSPVYRSEPEAPH